MGGAPGPLRPWGAEAAEIHLLLSGMFSAILPFLSFQNRRSPGPWARPAVLKAHHCQQPLPRSYAQPTVLTFIQTRFHFPKMVRRGLVLNMKKLNTFFKHCLLTYVTRTVNVACHSDPQRARGRLRLGATLQ